MVKRYFPRRMIILGRLAKDKKIKILLAFILAIAAGLFFLISIKNQARAERLIYPKEIDLEDMDPLERIGKSSFGEDSEFLKFYKNNIGVSENEKEMREKYKILVDGHPIEIMVSFIAKQDKIVAAFIIGIAKKESNWGIHSPQKNGRDCFNYWGYRGTYNQTASGYSCFDSPEQAVAVVGERIADLIAKKINTPERMIVWKCGQTCAGHDPTGVSKWITDVRLYYNKATS